MEHTPKYAAQAKYNKANYKRMVVDLHTSIDKDILDYMAAQDNRQGYIKALIRQDIESKQRPET